VGRKGLDVSVAALIRQMAAAGAPSEAIAIAVEAIEASQAKDAARKARDAARKARKRTGHSADIPRTIQGQSEESPDLGSPLPLVPPHPPINPNPAPERDEARAAHRLPRDFRLTEADRQFARDHGWSDGEIEDGEAEYVDYWSNPKLPASKALKLDWSAVWRNRVRDLGKRRGNGARSSTNVTRFGGRNVPETRDANLAATALHEWTLAEDERDRGAPLLQIGRG
jgi:hypothetical protein